LRRDGPERGAQLRPAVASKRSQRVARQALGVHPDRHASSAYDVALHHRDVHEAVVASERACVELARGRGEGDPRDLTGPDRPRRGSLGGHVTVVPDREGGETVCSLCSPGSGDAVPDLADAYLAQAERTRSEHWSGPPEMV